MTMTDCEIVANYKQAKAPLKQIAILADLNQCDRRRIVEILGEAGCELPGNYARKPRHEPAPALAEDDAPPDLAKMYGDPLFHERSRIAELASVIAAGDPAIWGDLGYMTYAADELVARLNAIRDWKERHIMMDDEEGES